MQEYEGMPTISVADVYGYKATGIGRRQGEVAAQDEANASGGYQGSVQSHPSYYWLAFVGLLLAARLLYSRAKAI